MGMVTFAGVVVFAGSGTASEQYSVGPQSDVNLWEFGSSLLFVTRQGSPRACTMTACRKDDSSRRFFMVWK